MKLTRPERTRILAGDHSALRRDEEPDCEAGEKYVLIWSRARTVVTDREHGETAHYPAQPLLWVEFAAPVRHRKGGWLIAIKAHDQRADTRFLGPSVSPAADSLTAESERGYRSTAAGAIDDLEAVDDDALRKQKTQAQERWARHQDEAAAGDRARRQERAVREQLRRLVRDLPLAAGQALLAAVERELERARQESDRD